MKRGVSQGEPMSVLESIRKLLKIKYFRVTG